jgi:hypothetical protein
MASYLLEVIYAKNVFVGMNLSWHSFELSVHLYFGILWENRYNVGPWLWKQAKIKEEKEKCELRGRHGD